jgi:putative transposase
MSRTARVLKDGMFYYIQSQSSENRKIFLMNSDFEHYIGLIAKYKARFKVEIYAYCLTPTAAHLVVYPAESRVLSLFMQNIKQGYALFYNGKYNGKGKVWGQRFKSILIGTDRGLVEAIKSVEFIPVKEGRTPSVLEYPWSSTANRVLGPTGILDPLLAEKVSLSVV